MKSQVKRLMGWTIGVIVLLLVFALYTRPDFMVTLSEQIWACF
jgi:hypothetical protein